MVWVGGYRLSWLWEASRANILLQLSQLYVEDQKKNTAVVRLLTLRTSAEFSFPIASACLDCFCSKKQVGCFVSDGWQIVLEMRRYFSLRLPVVIINDHDVLCHLV